MVVGHSIGAWVALEAVRRLGANQRRVSACLGLMPYLATETEDAGRKAALIRQWFAPALIWLLAGVAQLIGWLPVRAWRMAGLRLLEPEIAGYDPDQREIVEMSLPRFGTLLNILTLFRAEAKNHASPYDFSRLDGFRDRVCFLVSPGDPWCCSEVRATPCHAVAHCARGAMHAWRVARRIAPSAPPAASPHTSRAATTSLRAARRRRACPCIAWPACPTPSARSAPRAPRSSGGSPRPCASCAAAAALAATLAWPQAHGSRPRAARRDRLRARRCMAAWGLPRDALDQESCRVSRRSNRCGLGCLAFLGLGPRCLLADYALFVC